MINKIMLDSPWTCYGYAIDCDLLVPELLHSGYWLEKVEVTSSKLWLLSGWHITQIGIIDRHTMSPPLAAQQKPRRRPDQTMLMLMDKRVTLPDPSALDGQRSLWLAFSSVVRGGNSRWTASVYAANNAIDNLCFHAIRFEDKDV